jgi:hypothetical protein
MSEWERSTRLVQVEGGRPEVAAAIQKHITMNNLGPVLTDARIAVETISTKKKKSLFGGGAEPVVNTAIVTPRWLITAIEQKSGMSVWSAQLRDVTVVDYANTPGYMLIPDAGVQVTGIFTGVTNGDGTSAISVFVGLGGEPAAGQFKETLIRAVQEAKVG